MYSRTHLKRIKKNNNAVKHKYLNTPPPKLLSWPFQKQKKIHSNAQPCDTTYIYIFIKIATQ